MQGIFFEPPLQNNYLGHQIKEVFFDKVYAPLIEGKGLKTCLDVGGNVGLVSYYFSQHFTQVYTLEPSKEHFDVLTKMLEFNEIKNVKAINKALFIKEGEYPLYHPLI
ncbi:MAG: FkbM family methyltransferase [Patescibacteria group bacterium]